MIYELYINCLLLWGKSENISRINNRIGLIKLIGELKRKK